ncbi:hypothetical protein pb186bvf_014841 [Paramecium bursaria]
MLLFLIIGTNIAIITLIVLDDLPYFNYVVQSVSLIIDFSLLRLSYIEHRQLSQTSKRYIEFLISIYCFSSFHYYHLSYLKEHKFMYIAIIKRIIIIYFFTYLLVYLQTFYLFKISIYILVGQFYLK